MKKDEVKFENVGEAQELIVKKQLNNTPFDYVKLEGKEKGFIALGNQMLSKEELADYEEAVKWLKRNMWDIMVKIAFIAAKLTIDKE